MNKRSVAVFFISLVALATVPTARGSYTVPHNFHKADGEICIADFSGDGEEGVFASFNGDVAVLSGGREQVFHTPGGRFSDVQCVDIVGSPLPDAVAVREGLLTILESKGGDEFEHISIPISVGSSRAFVVGDVDSDGLTDVVIGSDSAGAYVMRAIDGMGAFEDPVQVHDVAVCSLAWININDDEHLDLVLGTRGGVVTRVNDGAGGFRPVAGTARVANNWHYGMWVGDYTGDGIANDILTSLWDARGPIAHIQMQPGGGLNVITQTNTNVFNHRLAVVDADGDGQLDALTAHYHNGNVVLAHNYEAGVGWSITEYPTSNHPRDMVPTFQTLDDGTVDVLVINMNGVLESISLTPFDACPLASPNEWEGSSLPRYLPSISQWELRDSMATVGVTWSKAVERRTQTAFIKPPRGEEPTCPLGAPQMDVDSCEVTASAVIALGDLMSNKCGRHSRTVDVGANTVKLTFVVEAHTADTTPRELGDGSVIDHMTSFVSQLLVGFSFPLHVDTTWTELTLFNVPWITALFKTADPTENTGIMRAIYELFAAPDSHLELTSTSNVLHAEISPECETHTADGKEQCKFTLAVDTSVCTGTKDFVLEFDVFCGGELCPNGHDTLVATARIEQQEELCTEHLANIKIEAETEATEDVVVAGGRASAHTTIRGEDASGKPVAIREATLYGLKLCARADEPGPAQADPCQGAPYHIVVRRDGETHEGMEVFDVQVETAPGDDGALNVEVSLVLSLDVIPSTWVGLHLYVVSTLSGFTIDEVTRAVRETLLPHETTVVMRTRLSEDDGSSSRDRTGVGAGVGVAGGVLVVALAVALMKKKKRQQQQQRAPAAATAVQMGAAQA